MLTKAMFEVKYPCIATGNLIGLLHLEPNKECSYNVISRVTINSITCIESNKLLDIFVSTGEFPVASGTK